MEEVNNHSSKWIVYILVLNRIHTVLNISDTFSEQSVLENPVYLYEI